MNSIAISLTALACVFGGALLGMYLRKMLPDHHVSSDSRGLVMLGTGLVGTMAAIVLGMMVSSAKASYDTQRNNLTIMSSKIILLDRVLAHYGPETNQSRELLRNGVQQMLDRVWPKDRSPAELAPPAAGGNEALYDQILALAPTDDTQRALRNQAINLAMNLGETRWLIIEQATTSVAPLFLFILIFLVRHHLCQLRSLYPSQSNSCCQLVRLRALGCRCDLSGTGDVHALPRVDSDLERSCARRAGAFGQVMQTNRGT